MNLSAIPLTTAVESLGNDSPQVVTIGGRMTIHGSQEAMIENLPGIAGPGSNMRALFLGHWEA